MASDEHFFSTVVVAIDKKKTNAGETLWNGGSSPRQEMARAVNDFIWAKAKSLTGVGDRGASRGKKKGNKASTAVSGEEVGLVLAEAEIRRRRYTAFMSDLVIIALCCWFDTPTLV